MWNKRSVAMTLPVGLLAAGLLINSWSGRSGPVAIGSEPAAGAKSTGEEPRPAAVEPDMHEFMEYVFEPPYKRLRAALGAEPDGNQVWKQIKSDGLILAEAGNLLLHRPSEDDPRAWSEHAAKVRESGGKLYRAAKAKDYPAARQHYEAMLNRCNACHKQFAGGEHQLKP